MELRAILGTLVIRFVEADTENALKIAPPPFVFVRTIQDRYKFLQVPQSMEQYNFNNGVTFIGGVFEQTVIDKLQIFEKGVVCDARAQSDLCDNFLDDLLSLLTDTSGIRFNEQSRIYRSQLEVHSEFDISVAFSRLTKTGSFLSECLVKYGNPKLDFSTAGFKMQAEGFPAEFNFERRAGKPYSELTYFTSAPLKTADHLAFLDELEGLGRSAD